MNIMARFDSNFSYVGIYAKINFKLRYTKFSHKILLFFGNIRIPKTLIIGSIYTIGTKLMHIEYHQNLYFKKSRTFG